MNIELPNDFTFYSDKTGEKLAYIDGGILKIIETNYFRKIMFDITYAIKGENRCCYCGKKVQKEEITIDHIYPKDYGGPTITNNMVPSCRECNNEKANLTASQYKKYKLAKSQKKGKDYLKDIKNYQNYIRKWEKYEIPKEWISKNDTKHIIVKIDLKNEYNKSYYQVDKFYQKYGYFKKIILLDRKGFLLDGFAVLLYAKNNGIKYVPTIKLNNVEVIT